MEDAKELAKQLDLYADAITGFSTLQAIGFILLAAHGDCFSKNIIFAKWWVLGIGLAVNLLYLTLLYFCQRERKRVDPSDTNKTIRSIHQRLRSARYAVIAFEAIVTVLLPFAIDIGFNHKQFFYDCKASCTDESVANPSKVGTIKETRQ